MLMKTDMIMFLFYIKHFLSDIRDLRYLHIKKVYLFVGHPVRISYKSSVVISDLLCSMFPLHDWWDIYLITQELLFLTNNHPSM